MYHFSIKCLTMIGVFQKITDSLRVVLVFESEHSLGEVRKKSLIKIHPLLREKRPFSRYASKLYERMIKVRFLGHF